MHPIKIEIRSSSTVTVDEGFEIIVNFTNTHPNNSFPGMQGNIRMIWANIDADQIRVDRDFKIGTLASGESCERKYQETPRIDGALLFYLHWDEPKAVEGSHVYFLDLDENSLRMGQIFHVVRVKSSEEVSQNRANWLAVLALVALLILEIIGWKLQGLI